MKKYLLTALLWVFGLVSFASASSMSFTYDGWDSRSYTPNWFVLVSDSSFSSDNLSTTDSCDNWCSIGFYLDEDYDYSSMSSCYFEIYWDSIDAYDCENITAWTYYISNVGGGEMPPSNFTLISDDIISISNDSWDSSWSLLPWWEWSLSWIIAWLDSTITEFIPYLVYLGLWIITVIIWFVAIRWFVNRTQAKIRWTFSSWRRRR